MLLHYAIAASLGAVALTIAGYIVYALPGDVGAFGGGCQHLRIR